MMRIRKSRESDLEKILRIYAHARAQMKENGNPTQWGDDWPEEWAVRRDIEAENSYVIEHEGSICGVFAFIIGDEPTYQVIEDGYWRDDEPYGTIHRLAGDGSASGVFGACLEYCEQLFPNIRMDTHRDNHIMQHLLEKYGYEPCGTIYVEDGTARIAYQRGEREQKSFPVERFSGIYTVRVITIKDIPALYDFCKANQTYYSYMKMQPTSDNLEDAMTAVPPGKSLKDKHFVGFWERDHLVAILDLICGYPDAHTAYIGWFMVEKSLQRTGRGSALIAEIVSNLRSQGVHSVQLACLKENREGLAFWQKNGFLPVEGEREDGHLIRMRKIWNEIEIVPDQMDAAISIIREVAAWGREMGYRVWPDAWLTEEELITDDAAPEDFCVGRIDGEDACAFILQKRDSEYWKDAQPGEAVYLHKFCVRRKFAHMGMTELVAAAIRKSCREKGIRYIRLDTGLDEKVVRQIYLNAGFKIVRIIDYDNGHSMALYEMECG